MKDILFILDKNSELTLQAQLREQVTSAIMRGHLGPGDPLPSSRRLAQRLSIGRGTVMLAYQAMAEDGILDSSERKKFIVANDLAASNFRLPSTQIRENTDNTSSQVEWQHRFKRDISGQRYQKKLANWQSLPYPFIYGQVDPNLFPVNAWRACSREALARLSIQEWGPDNVNKDDPFLIDQIRTKVLLRRGVWVERDEILVTLGAQNALWLLAALLVNDDTTVGLEDPGYADARNAFQTRTSRIKPLAVDEGGLIVDEQLDDCDYVYVTPSHHAPTTSTLSLERRKALLEKAEQHDFVVIEDDYEGEMNYVGEPTPALKSIDQSGRVVYVGSFSKVLAPGLRLGYLVGSKELILAARDMRRLILRHPPANNQRCAALFLANGHYDAFVNKLHKVYHQRWHLLAEALDRYLPSYYRAPSFGGTSFWLSGPKELDSVLLAEKALEKGIFLEPGDVHFMQEPTPRNHFRLGFSSIADEKIEPGVKILADLINEQVK